MTEEQAHGAGRLLAGRFELLEQLGSGGMGTVWRARDLTLEREVALKEMRSVGAAEPEHADRTRQRVLREARALARVNHANAVTVYEVLDDRPYPWLVMELVAGPSLSAVLARGPLAPARAAQIGLDVLAALRAAHASGILHRDVKPGNVLIRPDGSAVLTDFGIAALEGSHTLTAPGDIIGSPEYIAPERIRGGMVGPASDLWSLGMLLYVCVEGANPLRRDSVWETLMAACDQPLPAPQSAGPLAPVIDALLDKDPAGRPGAAELASRLAAIAGDDATVRLALDPADTPTVRAQHRADTRVDTRAASPGTDTPLPAPRRRLRLPVVLAALTGAAVATAALTLPHPHRGTAHPAATPPPADQESGSWIAQLASLPHSVDTAERDHELATVQQQIPGAELVDSDSYASLQPGHWIIRAPDTFADGYAAAEYCAQHGTDDCSGRYLSRDPADRDYDCHPGPTPDPAGCRRPEETPAPDSSAAP
ncbi:serine/threonine-protein kinase [Kitasatospora sp. NPDC048296]|uniref:serine/threonine-protein kinase n=1 Tax=Kitasatospora sp. NPDC048296 TaxID=3364048 RepID=UPI0037129519